MRIEEEGRITEVPISDIVDVRCRYYPTRMQLNRYECLLTVRGGTKIKIGNQFFRGVADFEDRSAEYRKFVVALHVALSQQNPRCLFHSGVTPASFYLTAAFLICSMLTLAFLIVVLGVSMPGFAVVKVVILITMIPYSIKWFYKNKPKSYRPKAIPTDVLPAK
ncbi:hypothetical protein N9A94_05795 [Akkermansiaceae bacterium]|nr:hypothetical protein [Akkermansiaceae bacterium]MDB4537788.1 hypothetical protein [Akkermansiaceae bacterium]MDB4544465.1 hypothetical protein [Akkermansiaceae bacterium]